MTDEKPMTVDALMAMVNRYAEACDDLGTDLFAQDATKHAALRAAAAGAYAQIRADIEQYGKEQYARGVNDAWPAGRGSGEPVADQDHRAIVEFFTLNPSAAKLAWDRYTAPQSREPLTDEQIDRHTLLAQECPPGSKVILVSSLRRLRAHNIRSEG